MLFPIGLVVGIFIGAGWVMFLVRHNLKGRR